MRFAEDFAAGDAFALGRAALSEAEIVAFARDWDPQRIHTDPAWAAAEGPFGGLIASGIQTMGLWMRLMVAGVFADTAVVAGRALEHIRLLRPLRPGMAVDAAAEVLRVDLHAPDRGVVAFRGTLRDGDGRLVLEHVNETVVRRRPEVVSDAAGPRRPRR